MAQLDEVVSQINISFSRQYAYIARLERAIKSLEQENREIQQLITSTTRQQATIDILHVRQRLRIPVGVDKYN